MSRKQFLFFAFICGFETYFFNDAFMNGDYLFAGFWGFLLLRDLRKVRAITRFSKSLLEAAKASKKKD
ncbi:DUF3272 family protein [Streptococcus halichoeri]|uniref:DUF3272 family protein n=1 Tax=Streptococcus halichoeri TaxID=254785 RepID=UPI000DB069F7|nr:DUF3272 family protein [Streptococcus halichoeri]PZO96186.1 MAG: DUF3272 domain-containing protein [Streptococcus pyogenes]